MYLDLFAKKDCHDDLRDLCMQAVEYCQSYPTWWKVLQFERIHENKLDLCLDMMEFLMRNPEESPEDVKSHQILETLLYMVQIEIFKDKIASAVGILRKVLLLSGEVESRNESQTQDYIPELYNEFLIGDLVILWICYISVAAFGHLPSFLFDSSDSRPSKIVSKRISMIDWRLCEAESVGRVQEMFKGMFVLMVDFLSEEGLVYYVGVGNLGPNLNQANRIGTYLTYIVNTFLVSFLNHKKIC